MIKEGYSTLEYKDKLSEGGTSKSKYSYLKHLSKSNRLHFSHAKAELKLINNLTTCLRFFQQSVHDQKDFESKFCIHIIENPRPFKYYSYFDYFDFFEFYQIHKTNYNLDVGLTFNDYLTKNDPEMFTTFEKFTDSNSKYKGIFNHTIYFLVNKTGHVMTLRTDQNLWVYIPKTFADVLKKENNKVIFNLLITTRTVHNRETIYNGMKGNVVRYGLKPFDTEYEYLNNEYLCIDTFG